MKYLHFYFILFLFFFFSLNSMCGGVSLVFQCSILGHSEEHIVKNGYKLCHILFTPKLLNRTLWPEELQTFHLLCDTFYMCIQIVF